MIILQSNVRADSILLLFVLVITMQQLVTAGDDCAASIVKESQ